MIKQVRDRLDDKQFTGVIEDIQDPKRIGRVKVRVHQLHGRPEDKSHIETQDLPWASPDTDLAGGSFMTASVGKVVNVIFVEGDIYRPIYDASIHMNYNLQEKLMTLSDEAYQEFYAISYDDKHQYYHDLNEGMMFDYVKSKINIRPNGNIILGLRDNKSTMFLGSEDATEPAVLGNRWFKFMDKFMTVMLGAKGGPYLGNMGADVIPTPGLMDVINEYFSIRDTFISEHIFLSDNQRIKPNDRKFDKKINADIFNTESNYQKQPTPADVGYTPEKRTPAASVPSGVAPDAFLNQLSSSKLPTDALPAELARLANPLTNDIANGLIPTTALSQSRYLALSFNDERSYLIPEAATSLDALLDAYNKSKDINMAEITVMKGYQSLLRQQAISKQYSDAPSAGSDPFGWANQVELYWGIKVKASDNGRIKAMVNDSTIQASTAEEKTFKWLQLNASNYGWSLVGRDGNGDAQWWHWMYNKKGV